MSENESVDPGVTGVPGEPGAVPEAAEATVGPTEPAAPPSDDELRSDEARRYRLRLRDSEAVNAELVQQLTDSSARIDAAERKVVEAELRHRFADSSDFWGQTALTDLRGEDGQLDLDRVAARSAELLAERPHWRAAPGGAAPAATVRGNGKIGFGPSSVLDSNIEATQSRGWGEIFSDANKGAV
jgi:hypothetical protein